MQRSGSSTLSRIISLGAELLAKGSKAFPGVLPEQPLLQPTKKSRSENRRTPRYRPKQPKGFTKHNPAGSKPAGRMLARHGSN